MQICKTAFWYNPFSPKVCETLEIKAFGRFDNLPEAFFFYVLKQWTAFGMSFEPSQPIWTPLQGKIKKYKFPPKRNPTASKCLRRNGILHCFHKIEQKPFLLFGQRAPSRKQDVLFFNQFFRLVPFCKELRQSYAKRSVDCFQSRKRWRIVPACIEKGWNNPDWKKQMQWRNIPCFGEMPTPEEWIKYVVEKLQEDGREDLLLWHLNI